MTDPLSHSLHSVVTWPPTAALLGQGRLKPHSDIRSLGMSIQQVSFSQPLGSASHPSQTVKACSRASECPLYILHQGALLGQGAVTSCLRRTCWQRGWMPGLWVVPLSWILFLSLVSFSLWLFALPQRLGEPAVSGEERGGKGTLRCCAGPSQWVSRCLSGLHGRMSTANPQTLSPCRTALRDVPSRPLGLPSSYHHCQKPPWALSLQIRTNFSLLPPLRPGVSLPVHLARPSSGGLCRKGRSFVGGQALAFLWPDLPWVTCSQSCVASLTLLPQAHMEMK